MIQLLLKDHKKLWTGTKKFHVLDHLCEELAKTHNIRFIKADPYESQNVYLIGTNCKCTLRRSASVEKAFKTMKPALKGEKGNKWSMIRYVLSATEAIPLQILVPIGSVL